VLVARSVLPKLFQINELAIKAVLESCRLRIVDGRTDGLSVWFVVSAGVKEEEEAEGKGRTSLCPYGTFESPSLQIGKKPSFCSCDNSGLSLNRTEEDEGEMPSRGGGRLRGASAGALGVAGEARGRTDVVDGHTGEVARELQEVKRSERGERRKRRRKRGSGEGSIFGKGCSE
jgi:hypothetical protein